MRGRTVLVIFLAVTCGVSASVGVNHLRRRNEQTGAQMASVLVAARQVPRGGTLQAKSVKTVQWPAEKVPVGALAKLDDVVGRSALVPLLEGDVIREGKLATKGSGAGLASMIPPGMRALTITADHRAAGVGGFLLPGNRVDVLLTTSTNARDDETGGGTTTTLLQNVPVLAVEQNLDAPQENKIDPRELKSVTLLVTPDQANKVDLGMSKGTLHLTLRNPEDNAEAKTQPATVNGLRFHQEKPLALGGLLNQAFGVVARMGEASKQKDESDDEGTEPRFLQIRTARGSSQGVVRVQVNR